MLCPQFSLQLQDEGEESEARRGEGICLRTGQRPWCGSNPGQPGVSFPGGLGQAKPTSCLGPGAWGWWGLQTTLSEPSAIWAAARKPSSLVRILQPVSLLCRHIIMFHVKGEAGG